MNTLKITNKLIPILAVALMLVACSILDQAGEMKTFTKCLFRLSDVQDVMLSGVDVQDVKRFDDLSFTEAGKLSMAALSGKMPLSLTLNVEVRNPNQQNASMNELYWVLFIDNKEITQGKVAKKVSIPPGGVATMPVGVQVDLFKVLSGESANAVMNFGLNLSGSGSTPSRIKLKVKPTVYIGMTQIKYPGFFTIEHEFVSQ